MDNRLRLTIPMEKIEQGAQQQIYDVLKLSFLKTLAIMPDVHQGYTLPIGGVALLDDVISPNMVGVDIGCGMCYLQTDIPFSSFEVCEFDKIRGDIESSVPVGFNSRENPTTYKNFDTPLMSKNQKDRINAKLISQLGTLGGGNHFIEVGYNQQGMTSIVIHSGSRGAGKLTADFFIDLAKEHDLDLPEGFLHFNSLVGKQYFSAMGFMTQFALDNRQVMMKNVQRVLGIKDKNIVEFVNENHNFASIEDDGILHRKGATPAAKGQKGVIPINMQKGTYITVGLGNEEFLSCASHGAGRVMSRNKAKRNLSQERFESQMVGVSCQTHGRLDESPDAYKDATDVIEAQEGVLIKVVDHLIPKIVVKG